MIQGLDEAGIGLRDPACTIDAAKIRIVIKNMRNKSDQWMKRKREKIEEEVGSRRHKPTRYQRERN